MNTCTPTHAHPATPPSCGDSDPEPSMAIDFQLRGLCSHKRLRATDVYCPEVRRSRFDGDAPISHMDTVSCWKGLSLSQATEIITWEGIFCEALVVHIRDSVFDSILKSSSDNFQISHHVEIDVGRLVDDMITLYFGQMPECQRTRAWFTSNKDLPAMVFNFIRTRDCFIDTSPTPCVQINLTCLPSLVVGDVVWQPPRIDFRNTPGVSTFGSLYKINPDYRAPDLGNRRGPRFENFDSCVTYIAKPEHLPLEWNHAERCFVTVVPSLGNLAYATETTLTAQCNLRFPGGVQFEQTSRYTIRLFVDCFESNTTCQSKKRKVEQKADSPLAEQTTSLEVAQSVEHESDEELPDFVRKRQKYSEHFDSDIFGAHMQTVEFEAVTGGWRDRYLDGQLSTTCLGEAHRWSPTKKSRPVDELPRQGFFKTLRSRGYTSDSGKSRVMPALRSKGSVKRIVFCRAQLNELQDETSPELDCERYQDFSQQSDQEKIRHNFTEFCRNRMDASQMSMEYIEESQAFEKIFREGSASGCSSTMAPSEAEDV